MDSPPSLVHALLRNAVERAEQTALVQRLPGGALKASSWRELEAAASRFGRGLMALGVSPGQVVAISCSPRIEWYAAVLGAMGAGAVPLPLPEGWSAAQVRAVAAHCGARVLVAEHLEPRAPALAAAPELSQLDLVIVVGEGAFAGPRGRTWDQALAEGEGVERSQWRRLAETVEPHSLGLLQCTSGATGSPRAAMLNHRALVWSADRLWCALGRPRDPVVLAPRSAAHPFDQLVAFSLPIVAQGQVWTAPGRLLDQIRDVRPTVFTAPPHMWEGLQRKVERQIAAEPAGRQKVFAWARRTALEKRQLEDDYLALPASLVGRHRLARKLVFEPVRAQLGLERATFLACSGGPVRRGVLEFFASLDLPVHEVYAVAEVAGAVAANVPGSARLGAQGRPLPGLELSLRDGELCVRGPAGATGYFNDADASARLHGPEGWLRTGDAGDLGDDGFVTLSGRAGDVLQIGARRVAPMAIELQLAALDPVAHAVVFAREDGLVALLALERAGASRLARERGWPDALDALAEHAGLRDYLNEQLGAINARLRPHERIGRFAVLPAELTLEREELTAAGQPRRAAIARNFAPLLEQLLG